MNLYTVVFTRLGTTYPSAESETIARIEADVISSDYDTCARFITDYGVIHWPAMRLHSIELKRPI